MSRAQLLLRARALSRAQYETTAWLRDAWDRAGLRAPSASEAGEPIIKNESAWRRYSRALAVLPRDERRVAVAVAIYDEDPVAWGRRWNCNGLALLRRALDRLTNWRAKR